MIAGPVDAPPVTTWLATRTPPLLLVCLLDCWSRAVKGRNVTCPRRRLGRGGRKGSGGTHGSGGKQGREGRDWGEGRDAREGGEGGIPAGAAHLGEPGISEATVRSRGGGPGHVGIAISTSRALPAGLRPVAPPFGLNSARARPRPPTMVPVISGPHPIHLGSAPPQRARLLRRDRLLEAGVGHRVQLTGSGETTTSRVPQPPPLPSPRPAPPPTPSLPLRPGPPSASQLLLLARVQVNAFELFLTLSFQGSWRTLSLLRRVMFEGEIDR